MEPRSQEFGGGSGLIISLSALKLRHLYLRLARGPARIQTLEKLISYFTASTSTFVGDAPQQGSIPVPCLRTDLLIVLELGVKVSSHPLHVPSRLPSHARLSS